MVVSTLSGVYKEIETVGNEHMKDDVAANTPSVKHSSTQGSPMKARDFYTRFVQN